MPNEPDPIPKPCVRCGAASQMVCARCGDSYCSVSCQQKDWPRHRPICFKMPILVPDLDSLEQKIMTMGLTPIKNTLEAEVTMLSSAVGDSEANISRTDGAKSTSSHNVISKQKAAVGYSKPSSKLAIQYLWDVPSKPSVKPNGARKLSVEQSKQKVQPLLMRDLKKRGYPRSKTVKVILQGMLGRNVMRLVEDTKEVEEYIKMIEVATQKYSQGKLRSPNYMPVKDEIVLALYDDEWVRACVVDPQKDGCVIQYIEYGDKETIAPGELLPASHEIAFDIYARDYIIDNIPVNYNDKQRGILLSAKFSITKIHLDYNATLHCSICGF